MQKTMQKLSTIQSHHLLKWMEEHLEDLEVQTGETMAKKATEDLGFTVVGSHVAFRRRMLGINKQPRIAPVTQPVRFDRITSEHVQAIAEELVRLADALGHEVSPYLRFISGKFI